MGVWGRKRPVNRYDVNEHNLKYWQLQSPTESDIKYKIRIDNYVKALKLKYPAQNHPWAGKRKSAWFSHSAPGDITSRRVLDALVANLPLTLPFNPNTGPGNIPVEAGSPSDEHAIDHDAAYANAITDSDIKVADSSFIGNQIDHIFEDKIGSVSHGAATIGALGIGIKRKIENVIGVQYPDVKSKFN